MKLRDYILNSSKCAFRSNLFVWNRFNVSLGFYEEHNGELCFNSNDGNTMLIGENVEIWFVMDDETIVFDDIYCLEKTSSGCGIRIAYAPELSIMKVISYSLKTDGWFDCILKEKLLN